VSKLSKQAIREKWRKEFPRNDFQRRLHSRAIVKHLIDSPTVQHAKQIAIFAGLPWEPDLWELWEKWPDRCVFPKANPKDKSMEFYLIDSRKDLAPGYAGILEPVSNVVVNEWYPSAIALVPGSAFDIFGGRVGSGAGFYDRFLPKFSDLRIGVAFEAQISQTALDQEPFDARMALLCTEAGLLAVRS